MMTASSDTRPRIWGTLDPFVEDGPMLGRRVANRTFLEALFRADPYDAYHFFLTDGSSGADLQKWVKDAFPSLDKRKAVRVDSCLALQRCLASTRYHCMHLSDILGRYTRLTQIRNAVAVNIFPVTGVTHSLSYGHFMQEYQKHLWAGVSGRDAIMVTSESARSVMERVFAGLRSAYGLAERSFPSPQLVRIPLGVPLDDLPRPEQHWSSGGADNPGGKIREEANLGDRTVFLCFGRISPASKMDLMPLFAALKRAESLGLPRGGYALVLAGWAEEGDGLPEALRSYGESLGIKTVIMARPTREQRFGLYAAADVFVSPSDNIQETFGLTVAEASAAGLPAVVSDFDGYRDIVVHEESGLLIPTLGFSRSSETELQSLWWYDNQYHLKLAQGTVVDVPALAGALARLGGDPALRRTMGAAGRKRVLEEFTWDKVVERYVLLWDKLAAVPISAQEEKRLRGAVHPQQMRFADYFQGHFSRRLDAEALAAMRLRRTATGAALYRGALPLQHYAGMEHLLHPEAIRRLLLGARKTITGEELVQKLLDFFVAEKGGASPDASFWRERAEYMLLWCLKQDYIETAED